MKHIIEVKVKDKQEAFNIAQGIATLLTDRQNLWESAVSERVDSSTTGLYDIYLTNTRKES